jgi:hypothetical protein
MSLIRKIEIMDSDGHKASIGALEVESNGALVTMNYWEYLCSSYGRVYFSIFSGTLNNGATHDYLINIPAGVKPHSFYKIVGGGNLTIEIRPGAVTSANGTAIASYNLNGNYSGVAPLLTLHDTPTVTSAGTLVDKEIIVSAITAQSRSSTQIEQAPRVGIPNTKTLVRITSTLDNSFYLAKFYWFEEATF